MSAVRRDYSSLLSRPSGLTALSAGAGLLLAAVIGGVGGFLSARLLPPAYEFVAFVRGGSIERESIIPRDDLLDRINGLSAAAEVAARLGSSPWAVWRRYVVTSEGGIYVARVQNADPDEGQRIVDAVRDSLVADLRGRYDAAMIPHRAYISSLEQEVARITEQTAQPATMRAAAAESSSRAAAERWVALAEIREKLRDAQLFAALSEQPAPLGPTRRLDPDRRAHQRRMTATGIVAGLVVAAVVLIAVVARARSAPSPARA